MPLCVQLLFLFFSAYFVFLLCLIPQTAIPAAHPANTAHATGKAFPSPVFGAFFDVFAPAGLLVVVLVVVPGLVVVEPGFAVLPGLVTVPFPVFPELLFPLLFPLLLLLFEVSNFNTSMKVDSVSAILIRLSPTTSAAISTHFPPVVGAVAVFTSALLAV